LYSPTNLAESRQRVTAQLVAIILKIANDYN
jgi:hypothetical protein